jgi:two-component system CheB/CheR fusion protein
VTTEVSRPGPEGQETRWLEISAHPAPPDGAGKSSGLCVVIVHDITPWVVSRHDLEATAQHESDDRVRLATQVRSLAQTNTELVRANQELTTANADLRNANEELLVANEEVQAATEEVETLNEELQATNEELETLNEELQATVEELNATNDDLEARSADLQDDATGLEVRRAESDDERRWLLTVLDTLDDALLVVDAAGHVVKANQAFRTLVGDADGLDLRDEHGKPFRDATDPVRRAVRESFEVTVRVRGETFTASGSPVDGPEVPYGVLRFRRRGG